MMRHIFSQSFALNSNLCDFPGFHFCRSHCHTVKWNLRQLDNNTDMYTFSADSMQSPKLHMLKYYFLVMDKSIITLS